MANYTAWRGAIEITIGGFPVPVNVALTPRTTGMKAAGFSLMSPDGKPVKQRYITDDESWSGTIGECGRGIDGKLIAPETVKAIGESERSSLVEPDSFAPIDSIDFSLASASYAVVADTKAAGAEKQVAVIWNGLRYAKLAYITRIVMRAGSVDRIIAFYADDHGLWAAALPFAQEIKPDPVLPFEADDRVGEMFAKAIAAEYEVKPFDPSEHTPEHAERRARLVEQALAGEEITPETPVAAKAEAPDLMALLASSLDKPKATKKAKAKKDKVAA
jgi:non-homologous end joining protein Ku